MNIIASSTIAYRVHMVFQSKVACCAVLTAHRSGIYFNSMLGDDYRALVTFTFKVSLNGIYSQHTQSDLRNYSWQTVRKQGHVAD